ncbi:hypothetical protein IWX50DRAFT_612814 [Phyllosticta citricarpa]|uniref:Uncharacterized protein n=1 Tax=Phyllosticta citricarpa TaxID=55181 RepID=A0ABR1MJT5_9PEZI
MYLARPLLPYQTRSPPEQASAAHRPPRHSKQVRIAVRRTRASASQYSGVGDQSTTKGDSVITTTSAANRRPCRIRTALRQGHEHPPPSFAAPFPDHHFPRLLAWPGLADKQAGRQCWTDTRSRSRWQRPSRVFRLDKRRVGCTGRHCCGMRSSQAHAWEACIAYPCRPTAIASDRAIPAAASRPSSILPYPPTTPYIPNFHCRRPPFLSPLPRSACPFTPSLCLTHTLSLKDPAPFTIGPLHHRHPNHWFGSPFTSRGTVCLWLFGGGGGVVGKSTDKTTRKAPPAGGHVGPTRKNHSNRLSPTRLQRLQSARPRPAFFDSWPRWTEVPSALFTISHSGLLPSPCASNKRGKSSWSSSIAAACAITPLIRVCSVKFQRLLRERENEWVRVKKEVERGGLIAPEADLTWQDPESIRYGSTAVPSEHISAAVEVDRCLPDAYVTIEESSPGATALLGYFEYD